MAIDEDQLKDSERAHTNEQVGYIVFERFWLIWLRDEKKNNNGRSLLLTGCP